MSKKLTDSDVQLRKCLSCKEAFLSAWIGNRICPRCKIMHKNAGDFDAVLEYGINIIKRTIKND